MRQLAPSLALALLTAVAGCGRQPLTPFTPPEGGYTVLMPGAPSRSVRDEYGMRLTIYEVARRNESYAVLTGTVPPTGGDLDGAVSGLAATVGANNTRSNGESRNGEGWREFEIEANNGRAFYSGRVLIARGTFYTVLAAGTDARLSNPRARAFIDSFRLSEGVTPGPETWGRNAPGSPPTNPVPVFSPPAFSPPNDTPPPAPSGPPVSLPNPTLGAFRPAPPEERLVGHPWDPTFRDEAPAGGWLVGLDVWYDKFVNNDVVGAVRPIFWANNAYALGQIHGTPTPRGVRMLAKQGYAIGAVTVRTGLGVDALTVTFMRAKGEWLDKSDSYLSEQMGGNGGGPTDIDGNGAPVTGIIGRTGTNLSGFGLTYRAAK